MVRNNAVFGSTTKEYSSFYRKQNRVGRLRSIFENLASNEKTLAADTRDILARNLRSAFLLTGCTEQQLDIIIHSMETESVPAGSRIVTKGDTGDTIIIVASGDFRVSGVRTSSSLNLADLAASFDSKAAGALLFGEERLLHPGPMTCTLDAVSICEVWSLSASVLHKLRVRWEGTRFQRVLTFLQQVELFRHLSYQQVGVVARALSTKEVAAGEVVIRQGDDGDTFYMIESGRVECKKEDAGGHNRHLCYLGAGDYFGERALLGEPRRTATVVASEATVCYVLPKNDFDMLLGSLRSVLSLNMTISSLRAVPLLAGLTEDQIEGLAKVCAQEHYDAGQVVIQQGDVGEAFYIVLHGRVRVTMKNDLENSDEQPQVLAELGECEFFGEGSLINAERRAASVTAVSACVCAVLTKDAFDEFILCPLKDIVEQAHVREKERKARVLSQVPILSSLSRETLGLLGDALTERHYRENEHVLRQGDDGDSFYIVIRGRLGVVWDSGDGEPPLTVAELSANDFFGESCLLEGGKRDASVISKTVSDCWVLERRAAQDLLGDLYALKATVEDRRRQRKHRLSVVRQPDPGVPSSVTRRVDVSEYEFGRIIGAGSFAVVKVATHKETRAAVAVKCLSKNGVEEANQMRNLQHERSCLASVTHPFKIDLHGTALDASTVYLVMELARGGELLSLLENEGEVKEDWARFYAAQLVLLFRALQEKGFVYRDLKPENILLDESGYVKLTDFGFAKHIGSERTHTMCGTPDYIAPEVIKCSGHGFGADWWSLGVVLYEMLEGKPPFKDKLSLRTYKKITDFDGNLEFQNDEVSAQAKDFIRKLLTPNDQLRLGCLKNGALDAMQHPWFEGMNWDELAEKKVPAPFIPEVSGSADVSNFMEYDSEDYASDGCEYEGSGSWFADF
eukprot:Rmarinus@m.16726